MFLFCSAPVLVPLAVVLYCNKIEIYRNGRREKNRMCKNISLYIRHEASHVFGQQLQIISVEENIEGNERKKCVEFHNFIYFVS